MIRQFCSRRFLLGCLFASFMFLGAQGHTTEQPPLHSETASHGQRLCREDCKVLEVVLNNLWNDEFLIYFSGQRNKTTLLLANETRGPVSGSFLQNSVEIRRDFHIEAIQR